MERTIKGTEEEWENPLNRIIFGLETLDGIMKETRPKNVKIRINNAQVSIKQGLNDIKKEVDS